MCGITGFSSTSKHLTFDKLKAMNQKIHRRGPDQNGYFFDDNIGLAMKRLSIIDISNGKQPFFNNKKTACVVFNGEIYNYRKLKKDLEEKGYIFQSNSDTEVLIHLYDEYGTDMLAHISGMFTFAIWDMTLKHLFIARDRLGIKPLYYAHIDSNLIFGSELKCILESKLTNNQIDLQAVDAFFTYTYIPAPLTIYKQIKKLEPGHYLIHKDGNLEINQYWDLKFNKSTKITKEEWAKILTEEIEKSIESHLISDVPLGAFLSGGVDSGIVTAAMSEKISQKVQTFTMGFAGKNPLIDERKYAKSLAATYNFDYHDYTVEPDLKNIINEVVIAFDEPFADDSVIPSYYISELASKKIKVALSGLGGDELFAGYRRYHGFYLSKFYSVIPAFILKNILNPIIQFLPEPKSGGDFINHLKRFSKAATVDEPQRYLDYVSTLNIEARHNLYAESIKEKINYSETSNFIIKPFNQCPSSDSIDKILYTDIKTYLPDDILTLSDRLSMWHSLELRVPLIDHELVELSTSIPSRFKIKINQLKFILKEVAKKWLPDDIIYHKKQGFESPMSAWLSNDLSEYMLSILDEKDINNQGLFNYDFIKSKIDEHISGKQKNNKILFSLIMFQLWTKNYKFTLD